MRCVKCGCSVFDKPFMRTNPKGEIGIFWCEDCVKQEEPELYNNEIEEGGEILKDLKNICYGK
jgi:hypothetical protein